MRRLRHITWSPPHQTPLTKYDHASLEFLRAPNNIFEQGLLSHYKVTDGDATPLTKMREGIGYFEESWCDKAIVRMVKLMCMLVFTIV